MKNKYFFFFLLRLITSFAHAQTIAWNPVAPGIWKAIIGKPEAYDLLKAAGAIPNKEAISKMGLLIFLYIKMR